MKFEKRVPVSVLCFTVIALGNVVLLMWTVYRHLATEAELTYSYIDRDYPLEMPMGIPTVEMTFQESTRFTLSDESNKANWYTLFKSRYGIGFTHLGPFRHRSIPAEYHSLHCVYNIELDFDKPNHATETGHHFMHCLWYLRNVFLCNADVTLEEGDFLTKNYTLDRMGHTRQCRDWTAGAAFVSQNFLDWAAYNDVYYNSTDL